MVWIKRNLFFVIGAVLSLALLGFGGFYAYSGWQANANAREERIKAYEELKRLNNLQLHPGSGEVDNIKAARAQQEQIRAVIARTGKYFVPPPSIPALTTEITNVTGNQFSAALRDTVSQLTREAANASVILPADFKFSFSQQYRLLTFQGGLDNLAMQLGEIKILCTDLFKAKINSLDAIQRVRVSTDDFSGPQTDYVFEFEAITNQLAIITPYQIIFRSFSPELGQVLTAFANSPFGIIVENVQIAPAGSIPTDPSVATTPYATGAGAPAYRPRTIAEEELMDRGWYRPATTTAARTGPVALVSERPLQVTMTVKIVRLIPQP